MKIILILTAFLAISIHADTGSGSAMCKCPMLKQVDAEIYRQMSASSKDIPSFAPLDIDYGENCTSVTITCKYPRFTRHRSAVYYTNGANFSTVRRYDLADKYSIRCNQLTGVWISEKNSEITYIQCAYRPMLINKVISGVWEELIRLYDMIINVVKTNFGFAKFIIGYD